ncbi:hypothetical protein BDW22DRAFT_1429583 [Trametopsis cervina]|nr:hypothetical protein BDW22DRAFT_1429583 [Trametopsis cervina]
MAYASVIETDELAIKNDTPAPPLTQTTEADGNAANNGKSVHELPDSNVSVPSRNEDIQMVDDSDSTDRSIHPVAVVDDPPQPTTSKSNNSTVIQDEHDAASPANPNTTTTHTALDDASSNNQTEDVNMVEDGNKTTAVTQSVTSIDEHPPSTATDERQATTQDAVITSTPPDNVSLVDPIEVDNVNVGEGDRQVMMQAAVITNTPPDAVDDHATPSRHDAEREQSPEIPWLPEWHGFANPTKAGVVTALSTDTDTGDDAMQATTQQDDTVAASEVTLKSDTFAIETSSDATGSSADKKDDAVPESSGKRGKDLAATSVKPGKKKARLLRNLYLQKRRKSLYARRK